jgi:Mg/Co/Ni transporter MgtE
LKYSKEASTALEKFDPEELLPFFERSSVDVMLALVQEMNPQTVLQLFKLMKKETVAGLFETMKISLAELLIRMMTVSEAEQVISSLSPEKALHIKRLLKYLKTSVGSYVDQTVFTLNENLIVKEALAQAKRHFASLEPELFVLSPERKLVGVVKLSKLISELSKKEIRSIMETNIDTIAPETTIQTVLDHPGWQDQYLMPVVDSSQVFLGVIRLATVRKIKINSDKILKDHSKDTIGALGDLYQIGLAGLLRVATDFKSDTYNGE